MKAVKSVLAIMLLLILGTLIFCACNPTKQSEQPTDDSAGKYYEYKGGIKDPNLWINIKSGKWVDDGGMSGTYTLDGNAISLYSDGELLFEGTLENGVLTIYIFGVPTRYYKDGYGPTSGPQTPDDDNKDPQDVKYTVTYHANGGIFSGDNETYGITVNKSSKLTSPTSPTRLNYTFFGWSRKSNSSDLWNFDTDTVESDVDLYAIWQQRSAVIFSVEGASIDGTNIFMLVDRNTDQVSLSNMIVCSNDSTWELYYDSLGQTKIPTKIAASKNGRLNDGDNDFWIVVTSRDNVQTNVYQLTVYRSYAVHVNYMDGLSLLSSDTAYTGYEYALRYVPDIKGYKFNGWKIDGKTATTVTPWGTVNVDVDKTANKYQVQFNENGGALSSGDKAPVTVTYDSEFDFPVPSRTGYSFKGWEYDGELLSDGRGNSLTGWDIAQSVTVKAKWEVNQYRVTVKSDNTQMGTVSDEGDNDWDYDSTHTLTANTNSGYIFMGWYDNDKLLSRELNYQITVSTTNPTYTAKWYKIQISAEKAGQGEVTTLNGQYKVGDIVIIKATPYLGYDFDGWYVGEQRLSQEKTYQYTMPENEVAVIAKFYTKQEMAIYQFSSTNSTCKITGVIDKSVEEAIIPDYVTEYLYNLFANCTSLRTATIKAKNISRYLFEGCASLQTVSIGENVTSIDGYAFYGCTGLKAITIPASVTSIGSYAFYNCTSLQTVNWNAINCTTAGGSYYPIFKGCTQLTTVNIGKDVQAIPAYAFKGCIGLQEVTIPDSVTSIGDNAFYNCTGLQTVNWNAINCTRVGSGSDYTIFNDCTQLTTVDIGENVQTIPAYAFEYCTNLQEVTIPDSVTSIGNRAFYCTGLRTVTIGADVESIGDEAFYGCTSLQTVNWNAINCTTAGGSYYPIFNGCTQLATVNIGEDVQTIRACTFEYCTNLQEVTIPDSVTSIGYDAFYGCTSLQEVTIPDSVESIGEDAFSGCTGITKVNYLGTLKRWCEIRFVDEYANPLYKANEEAKLYVNNVEVAGAVEIPKGTTKIGASAFYHLIGITSVTIPDSVESIGEFAFSGCTGLQTVNWNAINCTTAGNYSSPIFKGCTQLVTVNIGKDVQAIPAYAFYYCTDITKVNYLGALKSWCEIEFSSASANPLDVANRNKAGTAKLYLNDVEVTEVKGLDGLKSIPSWAFCGLTNLTSVTIPGSVESIGDYAFYNCTGLQTVTICDGVESIGEYAFYGLTNLISVTIPGSVTNIHGWTFGGCTMLKDVTFEEPTGWRYYADDIPEEQLRDHATAAELLTTTYVRWHWSRKTN